MGYTRGKIPLHEGGSSTAIRQFWAASTRFGPDVHVEQRGIMYHGYKEDLQQYTRE
jgi:hypothetical protein